MASSRLASRSVPLSKPDHRHRLLRARCYRGFFLLAVVGGAREATPRWRASWLSAINRSKSVMPGFFLTGFFSFLQLDNVSVQRRDDR